MERSVSRPPRGTSARAKARSRSSCTRRWRHGAVQPATPHRVDAMPSSRSEERGTSCFFTERADPSAGRKSPAEVIASNPSSVMAARREGVRGWSPPQPFLFSHSAKRRIEGRSRRSSSARGRPQRAAYSGSPGPSKSWPGAISKTRADGRRQRPGIEAVEDVDVRRPRSAGTGGSMPRTMKAPCADTRGQEHRQGSEDTEGFDSGPTGVRGRSCAASDVASGEHARGSGEQPPDRDRGREAIGARSTRRGRARSAAAGVPPSAAER